MGTDYLTVKASLNEIRHPSNMINVGMGEKQILNMFRCHRKSAKGQFRIFALGLSAIHKDIHRTATGPRDLHQVTRAGDTFFCAEMINFDGQIGVRLALLRYPKTGRSILAYFPWPTLVISAINPSIFACTPENLITL